MIGGKWRMQPYPLREYNSIDHYSITTSISEDDRKEIKNLLKTTLNGYVGQAYNYDDNKLTEDWMSSFLDGENSASNDEVIRTQLESYLDILIGRVQDRVCTELGVLTKNTLTLGVDILEQPVWGIDCYTRTNIEMILDERFRGELSLEQKKDFIERKLLPAINAQDPSVAHDMRKAFESIVQNSVKFPIFFIIF